MKDIVDETVMSHNITPSKHGYYLTFAIIVAFAVSLSIIVLAVWFFGRFI